MFTTKKDNKQSMQSVWYKISSSSDLTKVTNQKIASSLKYLEGSTKHKLEDPDLVMERKKKGIARKRNAEIAEIQNNPL